MGSSVVVVVEAQLEGVLGLGGLLVGLEPRQLVVAVFRGQRFSRDHRLRSIVEKVELLYLCKLLVITSWMNSTGRVGGFGGGKRRIRQVGRGEGV